MHVNRPDSRSTNARNWRFDEPFERISASQAQDLLTDVYGITSPAKPVRLPTERDDTFRAVADSGSGFVIKIGHPADDPRVINLQTAALQHASERDASLPLQRILPSADGRYEPTITTTSGERRIVRVLTFMTGSTLRASQPTAEQLRQCGEVLARLANALADFDHPVADRHLLFDLRNFDEIRPMRRHADLQSVRDVFDWYDSEFVPCAAELPQQVVHGDFSLDNIVVDPGAATFVQGVLDWGDVMRTWRAADLASGLASQVAVDGDAWERPQHMIDGYQAVATLMDSELALIRGLVAMRITQRLLMAYHLNEAMPGNSEYLLRNVEFSTAQLANLVD